MGRELRGQGHGGRGCLSRLCPGQRLELSGAEIQPGRDGESETGSSVERPTVETQRAHLTSVANLIMLLKS